MIFVIINELEPFNHHVDRGNAGGALVFSVLLWLLYAMGLYTYQKIHLGKLGSSNSTGTVAALLYHIHYMYI